MCAPLRARDLQMTGQWPGLDATQTDQVLGAAAPGCVALLVMAAPEAGGHVKLRALGLQPDVLLEAASECVRWVYAFSGDGAVATARFQAKKDALDVANNLAIAATRGGGRASVHVVWPDTCLVILGAEGPTATLSFLSDAIVNLLTSEPDADPSKMGPVVTTPSAAACPKMGLTRTEYSLNGAVEGGVLQHANGVGSQVYHVGAQPEWFRLRRDTLAHFMALPLSFAPAIGGLARGLLQVENAGCFRRSWNLGLPKSVRCCRQRRLGTPHFLRSGRPPI